MTATHEQTGSDAATKSDVKQRLIEALEELAEAALAEVMSFVEYQRFKLGQGTDDEADEKPPYKPVKLGGLWAGITITEEDLAGAREDMLGSTRKRSETG